MADPQDTLNRSWLKRGWASPSPTWGLSVPELWRETLVSFIRRPKALNEYGNMVGGREVTFWQVTAHCEIVEVRAQEISAGYVYGPLLKRSWSIFAPYPEDPANQIPHQGDFVRFTTVDGNSIDLQLKHVYVKDSLADHVQCDTIEFE